MKRNRDVYYRLLQEVRFAGNWEGWLEFFLDGVAETANHAFNAASQILELFKRDREIIIQTGERAGSALRLHERFQKSPYSTATSLARTTGLSLPTVNSALTELEKLKLIREVTGRKRDRVYCYQEYLEILSEGLDH